MKITEIISESKQSKELTKPRNFVAKNAINTGAGQHKDKKRAEKQGDVKHKKQAVPVDEQTVAEAAKKGLYYNVNKRKKAGTSRDASSPKAPTDQAWRDAAKTAKKEGVAEMFADQGSGSTRLSSRGEKKISNIVRKALAKNSETPDQIAARKDFQAQTDARMRQKKKEQGVAEGDEEGFSIEDMVMDQYRNGNEVWEIASNMGMGESEVQDIIDDNERGVSEHQAAMESDLSADDAMAEIFRIRTRPGLTNYDQFTPADVKRVRQLSKITGLSDEVNQSGKYYESVRDFIKRMTNALKSEPAASTAPGIKSPADGKEYPPGEVERVLKRLQKISGFTRLHPDPDDQMLLASYVADQLSRGSTFDRAVQMGTMEYKRREQGVAEGERTMSRAAKGHEKYGKTGMAALAKAGRDGAGEKKLDAIRDKHNKYDESATAGATSAGNVAVGAIYNNKPAKQVKNKDGTVKNALDIKANLMTGGSIKR